MTVSISNKGDKTQMEEVAGEVRSSRHQPRTRRRVRVCAGCSTCAGNRSATEILEAWSCAESDTR